MTSSLKAAIFLVFGCIINLSYVILVTVNGRTIIGGILPLHDDIQTGQKCGNISFRGIAIATAIEVATSEINLEDSLPGANERSLGYSIEDSCSNLQRAKGIAYKFNIDKRMISSGSKNSTAVSAVLGEFSRSHLPVIQLLNLEKTIQLSYSSDNALLQGRTESDLEELNSLFSIYPEDNSKMEAVNDIIKTYNWQSIHIVVVDNVRGRSGLKVLKTAIDKIPKDRRPCLETHHVKENMDSVNKTVHILAKNPLKSVVVLFCNQKLDTLIFHASEQLNMSNSTWITTTNWNNNIEILKQFSSIVDGMLVISNKETRPEAYLKHVYSLNPPFNDGYLKDAFPSIKGSEGCESSEQQAQNNCKNAVEKLKEHLVKYINEVSYTMDAVYAIYKASKSIITNSTLVEELTKIDILNPLTGNHIAFAKNKAIKSTNYVIYNLQGNSSMKFTFVKTGTWQSTGEPRLRLNKKNIRWNRGQTVVPLSMCSLDCVPGTYRQYDKQSDQCCWECLPCNTKSMSNVSNAIDCLQCPSGFVSIPDKTDCSKYEVDYFRWFKPSGEFLLVLITAGLCVTLFSLGIFSQNIESDVVIAGNYKSLTLVLGGVALSFLCVIPLLLEPRGMVCQIFVALFSISLTLPLSIFATKSSTFKELFYDDDGDVKRGTLGPKPKLVVVLVLCIIQIVLIVSLMSYLPPRVLVTDTANWNVKYVQCDCQNNIPLWAGFIYNIILCFLVTFLSWSGTDMEADFNELKHICMTICMLFLDFFIFVAVTFAVEYKEMTLALGMLSSLIGATILALYFVPKLRSILCRTQRVLVPSDSQPLIDEPSEKHVKRESFVPSSSPGMKRRLLQAKVKETYTSS